MPPFPPKNDVLGCRGVTDPSSEVWQDFRRCYPRRNSLPDILLRPFRGPPLRPDRWGRPGIADGMEVPSWGREQHPPYSPPITAPSPPGIRPVKSEYRAGEMWSGLASVVPLLD